MPASSTTQSRGDRLQGRLCTLTHLHSIHQKKAQNPLPPPCYGELTKRPHFSSAKVTVIQPLMLLQAADLKGGKTNRRRKGGCIKGKRRGEKPSCFCALRKGRGRAGWVPLTQFSIVLKEMRKGPATVRKGIPRAPPAAPEWPDPAPRAQPVTGSARFRERSNSQLNENKQSFLISGVPACKVVLFLGHIHPLQQQQRCQSAGSSGGCRHRG